MSWQEVRWLFPSLWKYIAFCVWCSITASLHICFESLSFSPLTSLFHFEFLHSVTLSNAQYGFLCPNSKWTFRPSTRIFLQISSFLSYEHILGASVHTWFGFRMSSLSKSSALLCQVTGSSMVPRGLNWDTYYNSKHIQYSVSYSRLCFDAESPFFYPNNFL